MVFWVNQASSTLFGGGIKIVFLLILGFRYSTHELFWMLSFVGVDMYDMYCRHTGRCALACFDHHTMYSMPVSFLAE